MDNSYYTESSRVLIDQSIEHQQLALRSLAKTNDSIQRSLERLDASLAKLDALHRRQLQIGAGGH